MYPGNTASSWTGHPPREGWTMRAHKIAVYVTGAILSAAGCFSELAWAQDAPARAAVQDASVKPIGKVISAAGSITVEHVNAVVVQAALTNQPGQAKIGDPIYLGDIVSTGADGRVGITFAEGAEPAFGTSCFWCKRCKRSASQRSVGARKSQFAPLIVSTLLQSGTASRAAPF